MSTVAIDRADPLASATRPPSKIGALVTIAAGPLAGALLGVLARWWMRLISDDPEFSWSGTIFIVGAFAVTGLGHSLAWVVTRARPRRRWTTAARVVGGVLTLPLFVGAGAIMLPTVVGASLCRWRTEWPRLARLAVALLAAGPPLAFVNDLRGDGFSLGEIVGLLLMTATYAAIVHTIGPIVAPIRDGWRMGRAAKVGVVAISAVMLAGVAVFTVGI
jgi:hypothetical protein